MKLRVEIKKNGKTLGRVGCLERGILGIGVSLSGLEVSTIEVPGGSRPDETAGWSFGRLRPGDVVTLHILDGGRRSRPDDTTRDTAQHRVSEARRALRFMRKRHAARTKKLEAALRTGRYPVLASDEKFNTPPLRIYVGVRERWTVGAAQASKVTFRLSGIWRTTDARPSFEAAAYARTSRHHLFWERRRIKFGTVVSIEVLRSGKTTAPDSRRIRKPEPSTRAQVERELKLIKKSGIDQLRRLHELEMAIAAPLLQR